MCFRLFFRLRRNRVILNWLLRFYCILCVGGDVGVVVWLNYVPGRVTDFLEVEFLLWFFVLVCV